MKYLWIALLLISLWGCSNPETPNTGHESHQNEMPAILEVDLKIPNGKFKPMDEITIEVHVSQGDEPVDDANEVTFEIWRAEQEEDKHEMLKGNHKTNGIYTITKAFHEEGTYFVVAHVTARDMHTMPKEELVIGEEHAKENKNGNHHHHDSDVMIHNTTPETVEISKQTRLSAHISHDNEPLLQAEVKFEIWYMEEEKHEYITANEIGNGIYEGLNTFTKPGTYNMKIHVVKDEIHEHQLEKVIVE